MRPLRWLALALTLPLAAVAASGEEEDLSAQEVQRRWLHRLDGRHFTATVRVTHEGKGTSRLSVRRDEDAGSERVLLRYEMPRKSAGRSFLLIEKPEGRGEIWAYSTRDLDPEAREVPSLRATDPFPGADYHLLGIRAARPATVAESVEPVDLDGRPALRLTEKPAAPDASFDRRVVWLDPEGWIALRAEHHKDGETTLVAETTEVRDVQGVATPMEVSFGPPGSPSLTCRFETMDYRRPIRASYFELPGS